METNSALLQNAEKGGKPAPPKYSIGPSNISPRQLQFLANKKAFLVVFCLTCVLQGTFHTYFVAVITTLEKLWNVPSRTIGTLLMASEVGQVTSSLFLPYYLGSSHRPRWIGLGSALFAIATLLSASPHLFYQNHAPFHTEKSIDYCIANATDCVSIEKTEFDDKKVFIFGIMFTSLLAIGFGQTAIFTLGIPYLDDNVANRDSPVYFSITIGVRILGPVSGFILGSLCTRLYINPFITPPYGPSDPRWLGAWWLGMLLISSLLFLTSLIMCGFPRQLSDKPVAKQDRSLGNFPKSLRRLLGNRILVLRTFSSVFHLLPISGLYTFLPKYLEIEFSLPAHEANLVTGLAGILTMGIGIFLSGLFIRRREPTALTVALWVCLSALIYSSGFFLLTSIGCGGGSANYPSLNIATPICQNNCSHCPPSYAPVCSEDKNYLSPCHAGCAGKNATHFISCACVESKTATIGRCPVTCPNFKIYLTIFIVIVLIHSSSEVGSMLLTLRCVEPRDKAMALGLIQAAIGIFGNIPCPVVYGSVVDLGCRVWSSGCGEGNCWVYDAGGFRVYFHGLTGLLMGIAFVIDLLVVFQAKKINFNEPEPQLQIQETEMETLK